MDIKELINSVDIVDYMSQYLDLEEKNGEYWCLSPFSDEKTPSFSVRRESGQFYCFSTGIGGNVLTFIKHYFKCSTYKAIEILKKYAGVSGNIDADSGVMDVVSVFRRFSNKNNHAKQESKTVLPENYMEKYEKRQDKLQVWLDEGISNESLDKFQVYYDSFSDRLVYPIKSVDGKIVNVGGRALDPHWKEKGQNKYCYFYKWGTINTIYGLFDNIEFIKKEHCIILFEGCKSVLLADTWGIHNCGALLTSHLSENQMKILAKLGCDVVFALDKDVRVRDDRNIKKLKQYVNVYYLWDRHNQLDEKDSPVDKGVDTFNSLLSSMVKLH